MLSESAHPWFAHMSFYFLEIEILYNLDRLLLLCRKVIGWTLLR